MPTFVTKDGAVDPVLPAIVDEFAPDKHGVGISGTEHNAFSGADELSESPRPSRGVVSAVQFEAGRIAIFRQIPERFAQDVPRLPSLDGVRGKEDSWRSCFGLILLDPHGEHSPARARVLATNAIR